MAKQLYKMDPNRTMTMLSSTGIFEHQLKPAEQAKKTPPAHISDLQGILNATKPKELRKSAIDVSHIRKAGIRALCLLRKVQ